MIGYVLAVDTAALVVATIALGTQPLPSTRDGLVLALLAVAAIVHAEITRRVEQAREIAADGLGYADPYAVWTFAGICLLPLAAAVLLIAAIYTYSRRRVTSRPPPHRTVFTAAAVIIAASTASGLLNLPGAHDVLSGHPDAAGLLLVPAAVLTYTATNLAVVVVVVSLAAPTTTWRQRLGRPRDHAWELASLAFAVAFAVTARTAVWLLPALLVPLFTAHRGLLTTTLIAAIRIDDKTGLATSTHWHAEATRILAHAVRRRSPTGVLMIDLDHFKTINDTHGHLAGDTVLRAVADTIRDHTDPRDLTGRFGGEEFVVLLPDTDPARTTATAQRIRAAVAALDLTVDSLSGTVPVRAVTVSIGAATLQPAPQPSTHRQPGTAHSSTGDLDTLLLAADTALYRAKNTGRNRVHHA